MRHRNEAKHDLREVGEKPSNTSCLQNEVSLRIHPEKTKVLSNQSSLCSDTKKEMQIDDIKIEILTRSESVRYLGQLITFQQQETTEIKNRIRAAWATFHKYRQELTSKNYMLKHCLRLRRSSNSDDMLRIWNMGNHQRACAAAWILWVREEYGTFEKVSYWWTCAEECLSNDC